MKSIITFLFILFYQLAFSQNVNIGFSNLSDTTYQLSDIRKLTFSDTSMNLVLKDGVVYSFNIKEISNINFNQPVEFAVISEINQLKVRVYPNPVTDYLVIDYNVLDTVQVKIVDLLGQIKVNQSLEKNSIIDVKYLQSGEYLCIIKLKDVKVTYKIIKQ